MSFPTPTAALEALRACLAPMSKRIHMGMDGSGETLDCCNSECVECGDNPLIRIETGERRPKEGMVSLHQLSRNRCKDLALDVTLTYAKCFTSFDGDTPNAATIESTTEQGTAFVEEWWTALLRLVCCTPTNQSVRFVSAADSPPNGGCAGWTMRLEVDVSICDCTDVT